MSGTDQRSEANGGKVPAFHSPSTVRRGSSVNVDVQKMNCIRLSLCCLASMVLVLCSSCGTTPPPKKASVSVIPSYDHDVVEVYDGETITAACNQFIGAYFKDLKEGEPRPKHGLTLIYERQDEARGQFYVYHAVWGYSEELVLKKREGKWYLARRENYRTYDF
jgi:hypothetical protein